MKHAGILIQFDPLVLVMNAAVCLSAQGPKPISGPGAMPAGFNKVNHVVYLMQENHSFDNYFGTFQGADGFTPYTCLPKLPGSTACVKPFHMPWKEAFCDLSHAWTVTHAAYDKDKMDGFSMGRRDTIHDGLR